MTVITAATPPRWGIWFRPNRRHATWQLLVTHGLKAAAEKLMLSLAAESKSSGDWAVSRADQPPRPFRDRRPAPIGAPEGTAAGSGAIVREARAWREGTGVRVVRVVGKWRNMPAESGGSAVGRISSRRSSPPGTPTPRRR